MGPLAAMVYPGRLIVIGRDPSRRAVVVVYAVTGTVAFEPGPRARPPRAAPSGPSPPTPRSWPRATPISSSIRPLIFGRGIAVSNGRQTADIALEGAAAPWPRSTPDWRLVFRAGRPDLHAPHQRLRPARGPGRPEHHPPGTGRRRGRLIYDFRPARARGGSSPPTPGENRDPLPSSAGSRSRRRPARADGPGHGRSRLRSPRARSPAGPIFGSPSPALYARIGDLSGVDLAIINHHERTDP